MKPLKTISTEYPSWIQPKTIQQIYELRTKDDLYGTLIFPKTFGSLAEAESSEGKWTFKRVGFFNTRITVRELGAENDIAVFKPKWTGNAGIVEMANGKIYNWQSSNFWSTKVDFIDANGNAVVTFRSGVDEPKLKDWFKTQARVEVSEFGRDLPELSILVMLGWYLIVVLNMDSSAGAVVAAAS